VEGILFLLKSEIPGDFYENFNSLMGMDINEFQATFLEEMISERKIIDEKFDEAYIAYEDEEFDVAEKLLKELAQQGTLYDRDYAEWGIIDIYLIQDDYEKAISSLEQKLEDVDDRFIVDDLLFLAEMNLLMDAERSFEIATLAQIEERASNFYLSDDIDPLVEAYGMISSEKELEGFKMLIEEKLIYNEIIYNDVVEHLELQYPEEF